LCYVVWWLDTNISEECAASIFRVEMCGEQKMDTEIGRIWRGRGKVDYSASQQNALEERTLNRA